MNSDRRTILYLVAVGRITPQEAERLLSMWPGEDDFVLRVAVCCAILWALFPHFRQIVNGSAKECAAMFSAIALNVQHTIASVIPWLGGLL